MWNCLPLPIFEIPEEEVARRQSPWRAESSLTEARLRKSTSSSSSSRKNIAEVTDAGGALMIEPAMKSSRETLVVAASDSVLAKSTPLRWPTSTHWGVSSLFNYFVDCLANTLLTYIAGVAEKMEKLEYY